MDIKPITDDSRQRSKQPWLTVLLSFVAIVAVLIAQIIVAVVFAIASLVTQPGQDLNDLAAKRENDGDLIVLGSWAGTIVVVPLILAFAKVQSRTTAGGLLGWNAPSVKQLFGWLFGLMLFVAASDGLTLLLQRDLVPPVMQEAYASTSLPILLWLTLIIAAPLSEELLFRGLMFQGVLDTPLEYTGAAVITSVVWSALHIQYDLYAVTSIFVAGLLLSAARFLTGSVILCMLMHAAMNLIATLELVLVSKNAPEWI
jgi:membrane protease YdiL (CAAX protease family)